MAKSNGATSVKEATEAANKVKTVNPSTSAPTTAAPKTSASASNSNYPKLNSPSSTGTNTKSNTNKTWTSIPPTNDKSTSTTAPATTTPKKKENLSQAVSNALNEKEKEKIKKDTEQEIIKNIDNLDASEIQRISNEISEDAKKIKNKIKNGEYKDDKEKASLLKDLAEKNEVLKVYNMNYGTFYTNDAKTTDITNTFFGALGADMSYETYTSAEKNLNKMNKIDQKIVNDTTSSDIEKALASNRSETLTVVTGAMKSKEEDVKKYDEWCKQQTEKIDGMISDDINVLKSNIQQLISENSFYSEYEKNLKNPSINKNKTENTSTTTKKVNLNDIKKVAEIIDQSIENNKQERVIGDINNLQNLCTIRENRDVINKAISESTTQYIAQGYLTGTVNSSTIYELSKSTSQAANDLKNKDKNGDYSTVSSLLNMDLKNYLGDDVFIYPAGVAYGKLGSALTNEELKNFSVAQSVYKSSYTRVHQNEQELAELSKGFTNMLENDFSDESTFGYVSNLHTFENKYKTDLNNSNTDILGQAIALKSQTYTSSMIDVMNGANAEINNYNRWKKDHAAEYLKIQNGTLDDVEQYINKEQGNMNKFAKEFLEASNNTDGNVYSNAITQAIALGKYDKTSTSLNGAVDLYNSKIPPVVDTSTQSSAPYDYEAEIKRLEGLNADDSEKIKHIPDLSSRQGIQKEIDERNEQIEYLKMLSSDYGQNLSQDIIECQQNINYLQGQLEQSDPKAYTYRESLKREISKNQEQLNKDLALFDVNVYNLQKDIEEQEKNCKILLAYDFSHIPSSEVKKIKEEQNIQINKLEEMKHEKDIVVNAKLYYEAEFEVKELQMQYDALKGQTKAAAGNANDKELKELEDKINIAKAKEDEYRKKYNLASNYYIMDMAAQDVEEKNKLKDEVKSITEQKNSNLSPIAQTEMQKAIDNKQDRINEKNKDINTFRYVAENADVGNYEGLKSVLSNLFDSDTTEYNPKKIAGFYASLLASDRDKAYEEWLKTEEAYNNGEVDGETYDAAWDKFRDAENEYNWHFDPQSIYDRYEFIRQNYEYAETMSALSLPSTIDSKQSAQYQAEMKILENRAGKYLNFDLSEYYVNVQEYNKAVAEQKAAEEREKNKNIFEHIWDGIVDIGTTIGNNIKEGSDRIYKAYLKDGMGGFYSELFSTTGSTIVNAGVSVVQGISKAGEGLMDAGATIMSGLVGCHTVIYDAITEFISGGWDNIGSGWRTGKGLTAHLFNETSKFVEKDIVGDGFGALYNAPKALDDIGIVNAIKQIDEKSINKHDDAVSGFTEGLGEVVGNIAFGKYLTGLATTAMGETGLGQAAAKAMTQKSIAGKTAGEILAMVKGNVERSSLTAIAGLKTLGQSTEMALKDGASFNEAALYGLVSGVREAGEWYLGASVNKGVQSMMNASKTVAGVTGAYVLNVGFDTVDASLEGYIQPALQLLYKNNGGNLLEGYAQNFEELGGFKNVVKQGLIGGLMSSVMTVDDLSRGLNGLKNKNNGTNTIAPHIADEAHMITDTDYDVEIVQRRTDGTYDVFTENNPELANLGQRVKNDSSRFGSVDPNNIIDVEYRNASENVTPVETVNKTGTSASVGEIRQVVDTPSSEAYSKLLNESINANLSKEVSAIDAKINELNTKLYTSNPDIPTELLLKDQIEQLKVQREKIINGTAEAAKYDVGINASAKDIAGANNWETLRFTGEGTYKDLGEMTVSSKNLDADTLYGDTSSRIGKSTATGDVRQVVDIPSSEAYSELLNESISANVSKEVSAIDAKINELNTKLYTSNPDIPTELLLKDQIEQLKVQREKIINGTAEAAKYDVGINASAKDIAGANNWETLRFTGEGTYKDLGEMTVSSKNLDADTLYGDTSSRIGKSTATDDIRQVADIPSKTGTSVSNNNAVYTMKDTAAIIKNFVTNLPLMFAGKYIEARITADTPVYSKIKEEGLVHITNSDAINSILNDGQLNAKKTMPFYHDYDRAYMFAGNPDYAKISTNISSAEVLEGIRIRPTDEQIASLSYRYLNDDAVVSKGDFKFTPDQVEKVYFGLKQDVDGTLKYVEIDAETAKNYHFEGDLSSDSTISKIKAANELVNGARISAYTDLGAVDTPTFMSKVISKLFKDKLNLSGIKDVSDTGSKIVDSNTTQVDKTSKTGTSASVGDIRQVVDTPSSEAYSKLLNESINANLSKEVSAIDAKINEINTKLYTGDLDIPTELLLKDQIEQLKVQREKIINGTAEAAKYDYVSKANKIVSDKVVSAFKNVTSKVFELLKNKSLLGSLESGVAVAGIKEITDTNINGKGLVTGPTKINPVESTAATLGVNTHSIFTETGYMDVAPKKMLTSASEVIDSIKNKFQSLYNKKTNNMDVKALNVKKQRIYDEISKMSDMTSEELLANIESQIKPENKILLDNLENVLSTKIAIDQSLTPIVDRKNTAIDKSIIGPLKRAMNQVLEANPEHGKIMVQALINYIELGLFKGFELTSDSSNFSPNDRKVRFNASTIDNGNTTTMVHEILHAFQYLTNEGMLPFDYSHIVKNAQENFDKKNLAKYNADTKNMNKFANPEFQKLGFNDIEFKNQLQDMGITRSNYEYFIERQSNWANINTKFMDENGYLVDLIDQNKYRNRALDKNELKEFNKMKNSDLIRKSEIYDILVPDWYSYLFLKERLQISNVNTFYQKYNDASSNLWGYFSDINREIEGFSARTAQSEMMAGIFYGRTAAGQNGVQVSYGHDSGYYFQDSSYAFLEATVEFGRLVLLGDTEGLNSIKNLFGEEYYNMYNETYNRIFEKLKAFNDTASELKNIQNQYIGKKLGLLDSTINKDDAIIVLSNYFGDFNSETFKFTELLAELDYDIYKLYPVLSHYGEGQKFIDFLNKTIMGRYMSKLTPDEIKAIHIYTINSSGIRNALCNESFWSNDMKKIIENLDSAIEKFGGLNQDMVLYRGTGVESFHGANGEYAWLFQNINTNDPNAIYAALKCLEGKSIDNLGYTSTSPAYATSFTEYDISMEINAPKGSKGAYINQISEHYNEENEVLLARGTKFKIDEVLEPSLDADGRMKVVVRCTIIE